MEKLNLNQYVLYIYRHITFDYLTLYIIFLFAMMHNRTMRWMTKYFMASKKYINTIQKIYGIGC